MGRSSSETISVVIPKVHPNLGRRYNARKKPVPEVLHNLSEREIGWIAGLLEGEGSFIIDRREGLRSYRTPRVQMVSTDRDVIDRLAELTGGRVNFEQSHRPRCQDQWRWVLQGYEGVVVLCELIVPLLGERRQQQATSMLEECEAVRRELAR